MIWVCYIILILRYWLIQIFFLLCHQFPLFYVIPIVSSTSTCMSPVIKAMKPISCFSISSYLTTIIFLLSSFTDISPHFQQKAWYIWLSISLVILCWASDTSMCYVSSIKPIPVLINLFIELISTDYFYRLFSLVLLFTYLH